MTHKADCPTERVLNVDQDCLRVSIKTAWAIFAAVVIFAVAFTAAFQTIISRLDRIEGTMSVIVGGCCPEDAKKWFGKEYSQCWKCTKEERDALQN